jgi:VanZ family protein
VLLLAWMGLVTFWSSQNNLPIDSPQFAILLHGLQHRLAHFVTFGMMGLLASWAFADSPRPWLLGVGLVSLFGAADEWHQSFVPGRRSAIDDWLFDTASAAMWLFVWSRVRWTPAVWLRVRALAPMAIAAVFVVGVGFAVRPSLRAPVAATGSTVRSASHAVIDMARSTRDFAREIKSTVLD